MAFTGHKSLKSFNEYLKVDINDLLQDLLEEEQEAHTGEIK